MRYSVIVILLFIPLTAEPCSCAGGASLEESFQNYDQVFLGQITVVQSREIDPPTDAPTKFDVFIDVIEVYKGSPETEVLGEASGLYRGSSDPHARSSCGTGIHRGYLFVVFRNVGETPIFSGCSRTIRYTSEEYLRPLEELRLWTPLSNIVQFLSLRT